MLLLTVGRVQGCI